MKQLKFFTALFATAILGACTSGLERPNDVQYLDKSDTTWLQHLQKIEKIHAYHAKGQERFSSRFEWQYQNPRSYRLKLYSLISKSSLLIEMHQNGMTVSDHDGNQQSASNAKLLLQKMIGMDIPLEHLAYWLKGQPAPHSDYQVGQNHFLGAFSYSLDGSVWTADYLSYHAQNAMPENILLKNQNTSQTLIIFARAFLPRA